jgi:hypothetical protein
VLKAKTMIHNLKLVRSANKTSNIFTQPLPAILVPLFSSSDKCIKCRP